MPADDLTGRRFGKLTAIRQVESRKGNARWLFKCDCGEEKELFASNVKKGATTSCGCKVKIHGMKHSPEYKTWRCMKQRCYVPNNASYHRYGAKGIIVCDRWKDSFVAFYEDMGKRPSSKHQIDRINNNGNYEPSNCCWATSEENGRNTSASKRWIINGVKYQSIKHAAEKLSIARTSVRNWCEGRVERGKYYPPKPNCYSYQVYPDPL